ncbi:hypothetical protein HF1_10770 [Mycoplasma haemofelis str. Langford 1]|uniref:Uncharacterized protein n=1 Tax=Mycoplasma haemofelis (strain Langford 1) TaxID=941640 RepID=E8ZIW4_MYCHL|nr:hypothetical protein [Mycoplasma haemofelis]CBY93085.1 hypothetical protein HF1_10770 [Mycoplasma haemofelis str. Langford 1]
MASFGVWSATVGSCLTGVGAFGLSSLFSNLPSSNEDIKTTSAKVEEIEEDLDPAEEKEASEPTEEEKVEALGSVVKAEVVETPEVPETPQCFIYEVKEPTRINSNTRVIKEILKRIDQSKEDFLSGGEGKKSPAFKKEISDECPSNLGESKNVYVWQDRNGWQYSKDLQKQNWLEDSKVTKPNNLGVTSKR